jgi:hypothetical protein
MVCAAILFDDIEDGLPYALGAGIAALRIFCIGIGLCHRLTPVSVP